LGEAIDKKVVELTRQAVNLPLGVIETVELMTMRLAPKQILIDARVNLKTIRRASKSFKPPSKLKQKLRKSSRKRI
jgi:hypothetical protein